MKLKLVRLAFIAAMPLATALAPVASSAAQPSATLAIRQEADLTAAGHVLLTIDYSCNPGFFGSSAFLDTEVQQPGAFGFGFTTATCDDQMHMVTVENFNFGTFTPGTAAARAFLFTNAGNAGVVEASAEVNIK